MYGGCSSKVDEAGRRWMWCRWLCVVSIAICRFSTQQSLHHCWNSRHWTKTVRLNTYACHLVYSEYPVHSTVHTIKRRSHR